MGYKTIFDIQLTPPEGKQFFWMDARRGDGTPYIPATYDDIKFDELIRLLEFLKIANGDIYIGLQSHPPIEYRGLTLMIRRFTPQYLPDGKIYDQFILNDKIKESEKEITAEHRNVLDKINAYPTEKMLGMKNSSDTIAGVIGCPPPIKEAKGSSFFNLSDITDLTMPYLEAIDKVKFMKPFTCKHCEMEILPIKIRHNEVFGLIYIKNDMYYELLEKETGIKLTEKTTKKKTVKKTKPVKKEPKKADKKPIKKKPVKAKARQKPKPLKKKPVKR